MSEMGKADCDEKRAARTKRQLEKQPDHTYLLMMGVLIGIAAILIVRLLWQFTDDEFERSSNHFAQQLQDNVDGQMLMIYELTQNMGSDTALWSSNLLKEESELLSAYNAIRRYSLSIDIADGFYLFYSNEAMQYVLSDTVLINKIYFDTINANLQLKLEDVQPYFSAQTDLVLETMGDGKHIASIYLLPSDPPRGAWRCFCWTLPKLSRK